MEQELFTELRPLYESRKDSPRVIRIKIRLSDSVELNAYRYAVDTTMKRYPYFCVELTKKDGRYIFIDNARPIVITSSLRGVELNSEDSNYHMIAFCHEDDWIAIDIFHGLTDGTGVYEVVRTLLYYYCTKRYHVKYDTDGIRLVGDTISHKEWDDSVANRKDLPTPDRSDMPKALNLIDMAGIEDDKKSMVYSIVIEEAQLVNYCKCNGASPTSMVALLMSRAIAKMYPTAEDTIRITVCVNQRNALEAPLSHHSLVGGAYLVYKDDMRSLSVREQSDLYRNMLREQTTKDNVLKGVASQVGVYRLILSKETDEERIELVDAIGRLTKNIVTVNLSYVGKGDFKEAEEYIRDFRTLTCPAANGITVEMAAVNGRFTLDFIQTFSSDYFVDAFMKELEGNGIGYELREASELKLPRIRLPWTK